MQGQVKDKLFNFRPVFFTAIAFIVGILFYYLRTFCGVSTAWLLLLVPMVATPFFFCRGKWEWIKTAVAWLVLIATFFIGYGSIASQVKEYSKSQIQNEAYYVVGRVVEKESYAHSGRALIDGVYIDGQRVDGKLNAYLPLSFLENMALGDEVLLYGNVREQNALFNDYGLRANAITEDIRFTLSVEECSVTNNGKNLVLQMRERMFQVVYAGMDEDSAAVTMAVLTGNTSGIDEGLLDNIRRGGIAHIFAVSGLHVGALYAFCLWLMQTSLCVRWHGVVKFIILAGILWFYGGVCGFSASIIRAIVLCLVGYAAKLLASSVDFLETLGLAGLIVLIISPVSLFEIGFQLSFSACLGIAFFQRRISRVCVRAGNTYQKLFPRKFTPEQEKMLAEGDTLPPTIGERVVRGCANVFAASLAAQIATAPILLNAFGYLSGWALLLNVVFVPIISAAFAVLLIFVIAACILPIAWSAGVLYVPNVLWSLALLLFECVDFSSFALVGWRVGGAAQIAYYGGWLFATDKWNLNKIWGWSLAGGCFAVFFMLLLVGNL